MAALEPYYFEPSMLLTPKMIAVKIVKDAKSVAGFSASRQFGVGRHDVT